MHTIGIDPSAKGEHKAVILALIRQAKFYNAAQARRWFAAHLPEAFALLTTPFLDNEKAIVFS